MLTASEILFLRDLITQLAGVADISDYTLNEVDLAMELLNKIEPVGTKDYLDFMDSLTEKDEEYSEI